MSWDITFCNDLKCTKRDCKRHHLKAHKAFKEGAQRLSFCNEWKEEGCKNYWKEKEECEYCQKGKPLILGKTDDRGIAIYFPNNLNAYGYDVHGTNSNGLTVRINYCPMCGRKLGD